MTFGQFMDKSRVFLIDNGGIDVIVIIYLIVVALILIAL